MSFLGTDEMSDAGQIAIDSFAIVGMVLGGILVLKILWNGLKLVWFHDVSRICKTNLKKYGEWAVVTGSTDGIGKAYAHELAKKGFKIILISRTLPKLESVAQELKEKHNVQVEIIQADYADGRPIYEGIAQKLENKDIGILVNNVGVAPGPEIFGKLTDDEVWNTVLVNVASVPAMTQLVLPGMLTRKRGLIVNISSTVTIGPIPLFQMYAASKAFVKFFSVALEYEYRGTGIDIQTVYPGGVVTNMTAWSSMLHKPHLWSPTAKKFARNAVNTIGYAKETAGYWFHDVQLMIAETFPQWLMMWSSKLMMR
ncbi:Inactive hydroxysteroid dehydrogenase-like protein 1 [Halocaridina rubra]|uniref:Inactive hydroxysteroid dehydrogenase-like protein 1 n=1 Tax=Halocaridina rubra TaxID=373956 RepID=A0AAN8X2F0_HALRR